MGGAYISSYESLRRGKVLLKLRCERKCFASYGFCDGDSYSNSWHNISDHYFHVVIEL